MGRAGYVLALLNLETWLLLVCWRYKSCWASDDMKLGSGLTNQSVAGASLSVAVQDVFDEVNSILTLRETGNTVTADGTEQIMYINNAPFGEFRPIALFLDLNNMLLGDATEVRVYYRLFTGAALQLQDYAVFTGLNGGLPNGREVAIVELGPNRYGLQVTLQQTAGTNRTYRWKVHVEG